MNKEIPLSVPNLSLDILDNLKECIETGGLTTGGRFLTEFEDKISGYLGTEGATSVQSGTAGLHLAMKVLGIASEYKVIVPTLTFIAAVNPIMYVGAEPVFMDCDDSLCIDPDKLEQYLEANKAENIKAIIIVHIFGNLANMERIMDIAVRYHIKVVEDATEALGSRFTEGRYKGRFAGTIGDIGVFSFNANKIITTGGGGMIVSNRKNYLEKMRYLSLTAKNDSLHFVHDEVGFNYRMLNIQAAFGVDQIDRLESFIDVKIMNYNLYKEYLRDIEGITVLSFREGTRSNHWFYSLLIDKDILGMTRDQLMHALINQGIQCRPLWKLIHTQKPYLKHEAYKIKKAVFYEENILNVPCSSNLRTEDVKYICEIIKLIIRK